MKKYKSSAASKVKRPQKLPRLIRLGNALKASRLLTFVTLFALVGGAYLIYNVFATTAYNLQNQVLNNPGVSGNRGALSHRQLAERNGVSAFLYYQNYGSRPWATFRDRVSGAQSHVSLSSTSVAINEWPNASVVYASADSLVVMSGSGPIYVREFQLSGSPLPTSATLVSTTSFGDSDSRVGDMIQLASGALVLVWHQQGETGPQGYGIAYRSSPTTAWTKNYPVQFMPSRASKQVIAQHPADGSVWVFSDPDAWGQIGAMHLTETTAGMTVDWTNGGYIAEASGDARPDPENPFMAVDIDPTTGTIALAYQSANRKIFQTSPTVVTGSYPVITRIATTGIQSVTVLPTYVERVSPLGLTVRGNETWLVYQPVDLSTFNYSDMYVSVHDGVSWQPAAKLGTKYGSFQPLSYSTVAPEYVALMSDGLFHYFAQSTSDQTAPSVALTSPVNGAIVSGTVNLTATATDANSVVQVDFYINGELKSSDTSSPYSMAWLTTASANGSYTLQAKARDVAGNVGSSGLVSVNVNNSTSTSDTTPPTVTINTPANGTIVSGNVKISAVAQDNVGVKKMEVYVDGKLLSSSRSSSISATWRTGKVARGSHTILIKAYDSRGNTGQNSITVSK